MNFLAGEPDVGGGRDVLDWNIPLALTAVLLNFPALLRGVVFVGEAALRKRPNLQRVGLRAIGGSAVPIFSEI